jgi:hypothetical protein
MPGPEVVVKTNETAGATGVSLTTGTAFIVGSASYGPETPTLVRSLSEGQALYGPRTETESQKLFDALNTFFALGGAKAYVQRIVGGSPTAGTLELEAGATAKTLVVTAKYKGSNSKNLKVEVVENGGKTAAKIVILNSESEVLEASPEFTTATGIFEWGVTHQAYVLITEGSGYGAGKGSVLKVLAAKVLSTGVNPTVSEANAKASIELFGKALGPGQLVVSGPEGLKEGVHTAMAEHASKNNRIAICDLKEGEKTGVTVATLTGEKGTYTAALSSYMIFTAQWLTVQGVTLGTTRTVPASSAVAGLCAVVAKTGNDNQAPAGKEYSLAPYVIGFPTTYTQAQTVELSTAGINTFREVQGIPCLYGFVSAVSQEKELIFWQASASRERMSLVATAEQIGESYLFKTIDGRKRLIFRFQADLQGVIAKHWLAGALFGETAPEAGIVAVGEPINTLASIAAGELKAELVVRISPFAQVVGITITSAPITEAV